MSPKPQKLIFLNNTAPTERKLSQVGEAIPHELGVQMIADYQTANPTDVKSYYIGRDILQQILAQPGCVGIKFYNAYNEIGEKTLVYVGIDQAGKAIVKYTVVNSDGSIAVTKATVGDRTVNTDSDLFGEIWEWLFA